MSLFGLADITKVVSRRITEVSTDSSNTFATKTSLTSTDEAAAVIKSDLTDFINTKDQDEGLASLTNGQLKVAQIPTSINESIVAVDIKTNNNLIKINTNINDISDINTTLTTHRTDIDNNDTDITTINTTANNDRTNFNTFKDTKGQPSGLATLDISGKLPLQQLSISPLIYKGIWNANTNDPTLVSSTGNKGDYYVIKVSGSTDLDGITDWKNGDFAIFNGTIWEKVDNTDAVSSVQGRLGAVSITPADIGITGIGSGQIISGTERTSLTNTINNTSTNTNSITALNTLTNLISTGSYGGTLNSDNIGFTSTSNNNRDMLLEMKTANYDTLRIAASGTSTRFNYITTLLKDLIIETKTGKVFIEESGSTKYSPSDRLTAIESDITTIQNTPATDPRLKKLICVAAFATSAWQDDSVRYLPVSGSSIVVNSESAFEQLTANFRYGLRLKNSYKAFYGNQNINDVKGKVVFNFNVDMGNPSQFTSASYDFILQGITRKVKIESYQTGISSYVSRPEFISLVFDDISLVNGGFIADLILSHQRTSTTNNPSIFLRNGYMTVESYNILS